tara:strand:+ start:280 stop:570 length:291 start_codon:yes stop_codon:yes gene_type:complete
MSTYRLLCGRSIPENKGGGFVTESELRAFEDQLNEYLGLDFNRVDSVGSWQGIREKSVNYTISADRSRVEEAGRLYKELNNQESVAIQEVPEIAFI